MKIKKIFILIIITVSIVTLITIHKTAVAKNKDIYKILVDVESSRLYVFKNNKLEREYKCAGGKESTPSPIGTWTIISKGKWGEGFGGCWMRI